MGYSSRENRLCCPKHAPLEKLKRSSKTMCGFLSFNFIIILALTAFCYFLILEIESKKDEKDDGFIETLKDHWAFYTVLNSQQVFFLLALLFFLAVFCKDPGYTKQIDIKVFH